MRTLIATIIGLGLLMPNLVANQEGKRHVEKDGGFSYIVPKGWKCTDFPGLKFKVLAGPISNDFGINIVFVDEKSASSLAEYKDVNKKALQGMFQSFMELDEGKLKSSAGDEAVNLVTQSTNNGKKIRQSFYFFDLGDGKKIVATCSCAVEDEDTHDAAFEEIMKSFKIEK